MLESLTKIFNDFESFKNEIFARVEKYFEFKSEIMGVTWTFGYSIDDFISFELEEDGLYINFKEPEWSEDGSESYFMPISYFEKNWEENMKKDIEKEHKKNEKEKEKEREERKKRLMTKEEREKKELERLKKKYDDDEGSLDKTDEKLTKAACQKLIDTLRLPISRANHDDEGTSEEFTKSA